MKKPTHKVPLIRFPEFNDKWRLTYLNEILEESKSKNKELKYDKNDVLSVSKEYGIVNQIEHLGRSYAGASVHNYGIVENGEIIYTKSPLKDNPYGIIKVNKNKSGIVSTLYAIYKAKNNKVSEHFIDYYFSLDDNTNKYLRPLVRKGAKNDMKINNDFVLSDAIYLPELSEQIKIINFLELIDCKLILLEKKYNSLLQFKKSILQKIFLKEIRFKNDNGDSFPEWETKKLKEVFKRSILKNKKNEINLVLTNSATRGIVSQKKYFDKEIANQKNLAGYYIVDKNDFVYNPRISQSAPVGPLKRNKLETGVMSPLYTILKPMVGDYDYLEFYFESSDWHKYLYNVANYGARHDRMNITKNDFENMPIPFPCLQEQKKIASFKSKLDKQIELSKVQLQKTDLLKKALLQQMFCN